MRTRFTLNGSWRMLIGERHLRAVDVPSSYRPVGVATLERELPAVAPAKGRRVYLCFDGVANTGEVAVDGTHLGPMLPFVPYTFDITRHGAPAHLVRVTLTDLGATFGYSPGWESYGGIIRDAFLVVADEAAFSDVYVQTWVASDLETARCAVRVEYRNFASTAVRGTLRAELTLEGDRVAAEPEPRADLLMPPDGQNGVTTLEFGVSGIRLWSPERPTLYRLTLSLEDEDGRRIDTEEVSVGFRDFRVDGRRFLLNGRPIFLKGVCRHDLWQDRGYTLTPAQMEQDILAIKRLGANYIRLVHYPHHRGIIDLAEKHGILVTEEPGLWNIQVFAKDRTRLEQHKRDSLEVMERTIRRDRGSPAVIAWLLGNECHMEDLGLEFLKRAAALCRSLDSRRPVSFSHLYTKDLADGKKPYAEAGLDFYDYHPYTPSVETFAGVMKVFDDKPLVFGEWGGWFVRDSEGLLRMFGDAFARASAVGSSDALHLNGIAYWEWADMRQYGRGYPGCEAGILTEGLVDEARNPKPDYQVMKDIFTAIDAGGPLPSRAPLTPRVTMPASLDGYAPAGKLVCIDLGPVVEEAAQRKAWESLEPGHRNPFPVVPAIGPIPFRPSGADGRPVVLGSLAPAAVIAVGAPVRAFHALGHVAVHGHPLVGSVGQRVAQYIIRYDDGAEETVDLLNAVHLARQNAVYEGTRIEPVAFDAPVVLREVRDPDYRHLELRYYRLVPGRPGALIRSLRFATDSGDEFRPLLYALTVERG